MNLLRNYGNGMTILGQAGWILLGLSPFFFMALAMAWLHPELAALPVDWKGIRVLGLILLVPGVIL